MKTRHIIGWMAAFAWAAGACVDNAGTTPRDEEATLREVRVTASIAAMTLQPAGSRSLEPMGPELENPIKQLAVIQFDEEGNLLRLNESENAEHPYFYWRDFTNGGELPGNLSVTASDDFAVPLYTFASGRRTRVCLIGNLGEEDVSDLVTRTDGMPVRWSDFLDKTLAVQYILASGDPDGEVGHVRQIYLFGYYEGELTGTESLDDGSTFLSMNFTLARLIARLELSINLGEDVTLPEGYHIYFGLQGVERDVYLFSNVGRVQYVHEHVEITPIDRTKEINNGTNTFYFYVAPHLVLADSIAKATRLQIWCTQESDATALSETDSYKVLICNDPLQETPTASGSLWINRNSIYHMNLTLTHQNSTTQSRNARNSSTLEIPIIPHR